MQADAVKVPLVIIGGGLSGLAAAIRFARFEPGVVLLEQHNKIGGLNSYYYRNKILLETGLHAVTNYADPSVKTAPLNRLLRQLKFKRQKFETYEQVGSEICFIGRESLQFSNDFDLLRSEIAGKFPRNLQEFDKLVKTVQSYDAYREQPFKSTRAILSDLLGNDLLIDMILCPLMFYGSSIEDDMDFSQFVTMFRAVFLEGFFRPAGTIKDLLELLKNHLQQFGGQVRLGAQVKKILHQNGTVSGVELSSGEIIRCDHLLSTIGLDETFQLLDRQQNQDKNVRLSFMESIFILKPESAHLLPDDRTIIFYNANKRFQYRSPANQLADLQSGVICFPGNFQGSELGRAPELRTTHLANFEGWKDLYCDKERYNNQKKQVAQNSKKQVEKIIGNFSSAIIFENSFTPVTIERFTAKKKGAVYGNPKKTKDGDIGYSNLFLAGTDQGFLGIIGSMLSGVSIVNRHILPKL